MTNDDSKYLDDVRVLGLDPAVLFDAWFGKAIDHTPHIADAWKAAEYPLELLEPSIWRKLFRDAGYIVDGQQAERPAAALQLYRGAHEKYKQGWSWTDDVVIAEKFANDGPSGRAAGQVWTATVTPDRLLASITDRQESEYVIDTRGLRISLRGDV